MYSTRGVLFEDMGKIKQDKPILLAKPNKFLVTKDKNNSRYPRTQVISVSPVPSLTFYVQPLIKRFKYFQN